MLPSNSVVASSTPLQHAPKSVVLKISESRWQEAQKAMQTIISSVNGKVVANDLKYAALFETIAKAASIIDKNVFEKERETVNDLDVKLNRMTSAEFTTIMNEVVSPNVANTVKINDDYKQEQVKDTNLTAKEVSFLETSVRCTILFLFLD